MIYVFFFFSNIKKEVFTKQLASESLNYFKYALIQLSRSASALRK